MQDLQLEMVTPMFLHGANSKILELRPPPFKSLFRYWWRATQAENLLDALQRQEGELFGDTSRGSPLGIRIARAPHLRNEQYPLLPHKAGKARGNAYVPGSLFTLTLVGRELEPYDPITRISLLLGGVGKRSRRGFGSVREQGWEIADGEALRQFVLDTLEQRSPGKFTRRGKDIVSSLPNPGYAVIKAIAFGRVWANSEGLLKHIGQATHDHASPDLGSANPRHASPVHVRVQKTGVGYVPIVTHMHSSLDTDKQQAFINTIIQAGVSDG